MVQSDFAEGASLRRRPRRVRWIVFPLFGLVVLSVGWTALWFYAVNRAGHELDAAMSREALVGRVWTCGDRAFSGFPLEIVMTCRKPSFAGKTDGQSLTAQAEGLRATVALYDPNRVVADLDGPLHVVASGAADVRATWNTLTVNVIGPMQFSRGSIELSRPNVVVASPGTAPISAGAASASLRLTALDRRSPQDSDQEIHVHITDLATPLLDAVFGNAQPAGIDATAVVSDIDAALGKTVPERLDNWRAGGGRLKIAGLSFAKGSARIDAAGLLGLDDARRPDGSLTVGLTGAEGLMSQAHLPIRSISLGGMLGGLLGGDGPDLPDHDGRQPDMKLPLKFVNGRVSLGPIRLPARLPALY